MGIRRSFQEEDHMHFMTEELSSISKCSCEYFTVFVL